MNYSLLNQLKNIPIDLVLKIIAEKLFICFKLIFTVNLLKQTNDTLKAVLERYLSSTQVHLFVLSKVLDKCVICRLQVDSSGKQYKHNLAVLTTALRRQNKKTFGTVLF